MRSRLWGTRHDRRAAVMVTGRRVQFRWIRSPTTHGIRSLGLVIGVAAILCLACETRNASYGTVAQARAAGAIQGLSIPSYLPSTASDVRWQYDIDTHEMWLHLRAPEEDRAFLSTQCRHLAPGNSRLPGRSPPTWWPKDLVDAGRITATAYELFQCDDHVAAPDGRRLGECFAAVRTGDNRVWFWRL